MSINRDLDLNSIIGGWKYSRDRITTRIIMGKDGKKRIQLRIDLGLLQMRLSGRPDGKRPYGHQSVLDYFKSRLQKSKSGGDEFLLTKNNCDDLRQEAVQYYHRYLAYYHMEEYNNVIRDTNHNIEIFELVKKYSDDEEESIYFAQFLPMLIYVNAKATALSSINSRRRAEAITAIDKAIKSIGDFFKDNYEDSLTEIPEIESLISFRKEILQDKRVHSELDDLNERLKRAIDLENYEEAAILRDKIISMKKSKKGLHKPL